MCSVVKGAVVAVAEHPVTLLQLPLMSVQFAIGLVRRLLKALLCTS